MQAKQFVRETDVRSCCPTETKLRSHHLLVCRRDVDGTLTGAIAFAVVAQVPLTKVRLLIDCNTSDNGSTPDQGLRV